MTSVSRCAGRRAPALQQHLVHGLRREEIAFQRERAVGEVGEAAPRLVAVGVEPVAQDERLARRCPGCAARPRRRRRGPAGSPSRRSCSRTRRTCRACPTAPARPRMRCASCAPPSHGDQVERVDADEVREVPVAAGQRRLGDPAAACRRRRRGNRPEPAAASAHSFAPRPACRRRRPSPQARGRASSGTSGRSCCSA